MSHRSARIAAAIATAEVSDPPRPSVVTRSPAASPWKPGITATSRLPIDASSPAVSMSPIRAEAWPSEVRIGSCQPSQLRAGTPTACSAIASSPAVTCSPDDTTTSYSRGSYSDDASRQKVTSRSVSPAIAETTTATSFPAARSRLTRFATLRMRSIPAIDVPPNFITMRGMIGSIASLGGESRSDRRGACPTQP